MATLGRSPEPVHTGLTEQGRGAVGEEGRAEVVRSARTGGDCVSSKVWAAGKKGQQAVGDPSEGDAAPVSAAETQPEV